MPLSFSIQFGGSCRLAVSFYVGVFGLPEPDFLTYAQGDVSFDANVQLAEVDRERVMHTSLTIEGVTLTFSDMSSNFEFQRAVP